MKRIAMFALLVAGLAFTSPAVVAQEKKDKEAVKVALQALQEYIGSWTGNGETKEGKSATWKETMNWGWNFKGDLGLMVEFDKSKYFSKGLLKYLPEKKLYQLTMTDAAKEDQVYEGKIERKSLVLKREDSATKDIQSLTINTNNDGARMIYTFAVQPKGKGIEKKLYTVQATKEGMSLASAKKNECCVTGGLGTIQVSYAGKTYYVCCSGCKAAFDEDAKNIVAEYEKKKKK